MWAKFKANGDAVFFGAELFPICLGRVYLSKAKQKHYTKGKENEMEQSK